MPSAVATSPRIRSARKINPAVSERTVSAETTLLQAARIADAKGLTRLADITGLDRIGIPVYSAIVPKSCDVLSVYNGKGTTTMDARTGALMEAIERQTAIRAELPVTEKSYRELTEGAIAVVDPQSFNHKLRRDYTEDRIYPWVQGYDLVAEEEVLVPAGLAMFGPQHTGNSSPYELNSSNGLASGNCFEEAVCHALCELIERDAWTLAELRCQWIPRMLREALFGPDAASTAEWDDADAHPLLDLRDAGEPITQLIDRFERSALRPMLRDLTSDVGIPCVIACVADDSMAGFPQAHGGFGAHPNAKIAVVRALTEVAQSRAVDIQGVREDLLPPGVVVNPSERLTQRVQKIHPERWMLQHEGVQRLFRDMPSIENEDLADDIRLILSRLTQHGIERVIVVDFSEPGPFSVVRVLVPGLEFWALDQGKVGERAVRFWNRHA